MIKRICFGNDVLMDIRKIRILVGRIKSAFPHFRTKFSVNTKGRFIVIRYWFGLSKLGEKLHRDRE